MPQNTKFKGQGPQGPADWPPNVTIMTLDELDNLGIGDDNKLYWHGKEVETKNSLNLNIWQNVLAFIAALGTLASGFFAALEYLYPHH